MYNNASEDVSQRGSNSQILVELGIFVIYDLLGERLSVPVYLFFSFPS